MATLVCKPKQVSKNLLSPLQERARYVVECRFGLGKDPEKRTLESIGQEYGITRERVRQIENFALSHAKRSPVYEEEQKALKELEELILSLGGVVPERDLLEHISKEESIKNHVYFLLMLGDKFEKKREDQHFNHRWVVDQEVSQKVHQALHNLYQNFSENDLIGENEILESFKKHLSGVSEAYRGDQTVLKRWLNISKVIGRNPLGEWGLTASPNVRPRGIRDYAYLVIRRHGSPLHFTEVAKLINELFGKPAHIATCHNELIKDKGRFVLVGRGLYGLTEWGYSNGIVRDVIKKILKENGPMSKEELIEKILKERYVKENTVAVNLQNKKYFVRDEGWDYTLA